MTQRQIKKKADGYGEKLRKLNDQIRLVQLKWQILQQRCRHPNIKNGGTENSYCPDCGWS